ncbi:MAG TPA: hypothetical protein P5268_02345 [Candidatus Marinimicrobia bacterium]|nr:hypothetical protein [Candidatus Neomarinimicrobiota bacterium]HRS52014.1 hypothetical protein [Candidatus Neomarinimicrobiota bacterium]HRU91857.1 hypothetical protein [Candidatus Neomarinimicrobiota bacterium]
MTAWIDSHLTKLDVGSALKTCRNINGIILVNLRYENKPFEG